MQGSGWNKGLAAWPSIAPSSLRWLDVAGLALIVALSVYLKLELFTPVGPYIFFDEMLYGLGARAIAGDGVYPSGHYPFLYPLFLAPQYLGGAGYDGIFVSNVLATSTLPVAGWLLARSCGARLGTPAALCLALLPIHFTYPTQVLSENLFVPTFAFAAWYAVRGRFDGAWASFAYGAFLAGLFLTKYLALPAVPLLAAFWLLGMRQAGADARRLGLAAGAALAGAALLLAAWVAYAAHSGIGIGAAFGGGLSAYRDSSRITPGSLGFWAAIYVATLLLASGPALAKLLEQAMLFLRAPLRYLGEGPYARLAVLTMLLAGGYVLVCVHHSASMAMNYPDPQRVVARYFMHIVPLVVVLGVCGIAHGLGRRGGPVVTVVASLLCGLGLWAGWQVLYQDAVWTLPEWFASIPLLATDIMGYRREGVVEASIIVGVLSLLMARIPIVRWLFPLAVAAILLEGSSYVGQRARGETAYRPVHARMLAPYVLADMHEGKRVLVIAGAPRVTVEDMRQALLFWGADASLLEVVGEDRGAGLPKGVDSAYRISVRRSPELELVKDYWLGTRQINIYREDPARLMAFEERPDLPGARVSVRVLAPCSGSDVAELEWDFNPEHPGTVSIIAVDENGREHVFAQQHSAGTQLSGPWVRAETRFRFRSADSGRLLKEVEPDRGACAP